MATRGEIEESSQPSATASERSGPCGFEHAGQGTRDVDLASGASNVKKVIPRHSGQAVGMIACDIDEAGSSW